MSMDQFFQPIYDFNFCLMEFAFILVEACLFFTTGPSAIHALFFMAVANFSHLFSKQTDSSGEITRLILGVSVLFQENLVIMYFQYQSS